ncbi:MAG: tetratricopeptide repeat protein [Tateyamaria sp.]
MNIVQFLESSMTFTRRHLTFVRKNFKRSVRPLFLLPVLFVGVMACTEAVGAGRGNGIEPKAGAEAAIQRGSLAFQAGDVSEARRIWREEAERGNPTAQYFLGGSYECSCSSSVDYAEAARWYRRAADQGLPVAQTSLGEMYRDGKGVRQDHSAAVQWYRLAATQGYPRAQYSMAYMYYNGFGLEHDTLQELMWLHIASINDFRDATAQLKHRKRDTPAEVFTHSRERAQICIASGYKEC